ncbi:MAG: Sapep family Mn(2+)-dependent dipeptidase [Coriobacteriia bacterium]|nr:Sapep family Mn(2+)-dependent dipeptidase [Coriobacteriia bacterium]
MDADFIKDLSRIIEIDSISTHEDFPDNAKCSLCLEEMLNICESYGFKSNNIDGVVGYVDWGPDSEDYVACLSHLDVVPPKDGWNTDPFKLTEVGDKFFARGVLDDKGPTMCCFYAMKSLRDDGVIPKKKFRMIFGTNEECGSHEIEHYLAHEKAPEFCFTPDSEYPITYAEKGIVNYKINYKFDHKVQVKGDMNRNRVPEELTVIIDGHEFYAKGRGAHAAWPFCGENALIKVAGIISKSDVDEDVRIYFSSLYNGFVDNHDGRRIGLDEFDLSKDPSQTFICTPYKLSYKDGIISVNISIRYPTFVTETEIENKIFKYFPNTTHEVRRAVPPAFMDVENENAQKLLKAYRDITGDMSKPVSSTGGTYAKHLPNTVAFGAAFQNRSSIQNVVHNANEYMYKQDLAKNLEIYKAAIYNLVS